MLCYSMDLHRFQGKRYYEFLKYAMQHSDVFSLVYIWPRALSETEALTSNSYYINLKPYCIKVRQDPTWPNTTELPVGMPGETPVYNYQYRICFYRCREDAILYRQLCKDELPNWKNPTDLCFYQNHVCWFSSTVHEGFASFYFEHPSPFQELRKRGLIRGRGQVFHAQGYYEDYTL